MKFFKTYKEIELKYVYDDKNYEWIFSQFQCNKLLFKTSIFETHKKLLPSDGCISHTIFVCALMRSADKKIIIFFIICIPTQMLAVIHNTQKTNIIIYDVTPKPEWWWRNLLEEFDFLRVVCLLICVLFFYYFQLVRSWLLVRHYRRPSI